MFSHLSQPFLNRFQHFKKFFRLIIAQKSEFRDLQKDLSGQITLISSLTPDSSSENLSEKSFFFRKTNHKIGFLDPDFVRKTL